MHGRDHCMAIAIEMITSICKLPLREPPTAQLPCRSPCAASPPAVVTALLGGRGALCHCMFARSIALRLAHCARPSVGPASQGSGGLHELGLNLDPQMEERIAQMLEEVDPDDLVDGEDYQYMDMTELVDAAQRAATKAREMKESSARSRQASTSGISEPTSQESRQASHAHPPGRATGQSAGSHDQQQQQPPVRSKATASSSTSDPESRSDTPTSRPWQGSRKRAKCDDAGAETADAVQAPAPLDDDEPEEGLEEGAPAMTKGAYRRRAAVLVELLSAGPALEEKLVAFRSEIDEALLHMALRRLKAAQDLQQEPELINHLRDMCNILRVQYERNTASPAMRLLDDVLELLGEDPGAPEYSERRRAAAARMHAAFSGGAAQELDIFAAAAALAEERAAAADALTLEAVAIDAFIAEAGALLAEGREEHAALAEALAAFEENTQQRAAKPWELSAEEQRQQQEREQEVLVVTQLLQKRKLSLEQLADLVSIAHSFQGQGSRTTASLQW